MPQGDRTLEVRPAPAAGRTTAADAVLQWRWAGDLRRAWSTWSRTSRFEPTIELLNRIASASGPDGRFDEIAVHRGIHLWQFVPSFIWPEVFRSYELAVALGRLLDECRPLSIRITAGDEPANAVWPHVAAAVALDRRLVIESASAQRPPGHRRPAVQRALLTTRSLAMGRLMSSGRRPLPRRLLYATIARHVSASPTGTGYWDEQLSPLLPALTDRGWDVGGLDCPYGSRRVVLKALRRRRQHLPEVAWNVFERWSTAAPLIGPRFDEAGRRMRSVLLRADLEADVPIAAVLDPIISVVVGDLLPRCAAIIDAAERIIDDLRPEVILATYETGPYQRALLAVAGRRRIPTVGLQHGMIFENHYDYQHRDVSPSGTGATGFIVPNVTCVWGERWRRSLVDEGAYPAEAVAVTGSWRHDGLGAPHWESESNVESGFALLLPGRRDPASFVERALPVVRAAGYEPLVKVHPGDDPAPVIAALAAAGVSQSALQEGLFPALRSCAVAVAEMSTTVAEAMYAGRPVVLFDRLRHVGAKAYLESGGCLHATDEGSLHAALDEIAWPQRRAEMVRAGRRFGETAFGASDGASARRVVDVIDDLARRR